MTRRNSSEPGLRWKGRNGGGRGTPGGGGAPHEVVPLEGKARLRKVEKGEGAHPLLNLDPPPSQQFTPGYQVEEEQPEMGLLLERQHKIGLPGGGGQSKLELPQREQHVLQRPQKEQPMTELLQEMQLPQGGAARGKAASGGAAQEEAASKEAAAPRGAAHGGVDSGGAAEDEAAPGGAAR